MYNVRRLCLFALFLWLCPLWACGRFVHLYPCALFGGHLWGGWLCGCSFAPVGRFRGLWAVRTGRGGHLYPCALFGRPVACSCGCGAVCPCSCGCSSYSGGRRYSSPLLACSGWFVICWRVCLFLFRFACAPCWPFSRPVGGSYRAGRSSVPLCPVWPSCGCYFIFAIIFLTKVAGAVPNVSLKSK